ncbi:MAG: hypothetical protein AAB970_01245, partial [Patescibacteria group bacterium]
MPFAIPKVGVTKVGEVEKTTFPVPVSSESDPAKLAEVMESVFVPYNVPEVGKVTLVEAVEVKIKGKAPLVEKASTKVIFFVAAKVNISVPAKVMALVPRVVESETVKVFPAPKVNVPVPV